MGRFTNNDNVMEEEEDNNDFSLVTNPTFKIVRDSIEYEINVEVQQDEEFKPLKITVTNCSDPTDTDYHISRNITLTGNPLKSYVQNHLIIYKAETGKLKYITISKDPLWTRKSQTLGVSTLHASKKSVA